MIRLQSYSCIDSSKASPHLLQQKQKKDQAFAFNLHYRVVTEMCSDLTLKNPSATEIMLFNYLYDTIPRMC